MRRWTVAAAAALSSCHGPETEERPPEDTGPPAPAFTCGGVEVDRLSWGALAAVSGSFNFGYSVDEIAAQLPASGPTCDEPWVNQGSYDMPGVPIGSTCLVDETLAAWCRANVPCWTGDGCPPLGEMLWRLGVTNPESTYPFTGFDYATTEQGSWYPIIVESETNPGPPTVVDLYLPGVDFAPRFFAFLVPADGTLADGELYLVSAYQTFHPLYETTP